MIKFRSARVHLGLAWASGAGGNGCTLRETVSLCVSSKAMRSSVKLIVLKMSFRLGATGKNVEKRVVLLICAGMQGWLLGGVAWGTPGLFPVQVAHLRWALARPRHVVDASWVWGELSNDLNMLLTGLPVPVLRGCLRNPSYHQHCLELLASRFQR